MVCIASPDFQSPIDHITRVFSRFRAHSQILKPHKYTFLQERVLILGHNVSIKGIETNSNMTKLIKDWSAPSNLKELYTFLGLTNYYRRFIPGHAEIAENVHNQKEIS